MLGWTSLGNQLRSKQQRRAGTLHSIRWGSRGRKRVRAQDWEKGRIQEQLHSGEAVGNGYFHHRRKREGRKQPPLPWRRHPPCARTRPRSRDGARLLPKQSRDKSILQRRKQRLREVKLIFFSAFFLGLHPLHLEVPRLGVESELQLPAYARATATPDLSHVCDLHHSSRQHQILNPLNGAQDGTCIFMDTSRGHNPLSHRGNSKANI